MISLVPIFEHIKKVYLFTSIYVAKHILESNYENKISVN